jgi:UDP-GlcNAc:undecaprenyl-phosphate GlcNAc-1-phosphate transferase
MTLLAVFAIALVAGTVLTRLALSLAPRIRFLDRVGAEAHKQHAKTVPYGGGPAFLTAAAIAVAIGLFVLGVPHTQAPDHGRLWPAVIGGLLLSLLGMRDDWKAIAAKPKLFVMIAIAAATVWICNLPIDSLERLVPGLGYAAAVFWLVAVANAYNLIDHADGLAAGIGVISAAVLLSGCLFADDLRLAVVWIALIGALVGYLIYNRPPARIYMGDAGSLPLGYLIGVGTLSVTFWPEGRSGSWLSLSAPLLITIIPLFDATAVVIKRLRRGKPIMQGDRNHVGHRLVRLGLTPMAAWGVVMLLQLALAGGALQLRTGDLTTGIVVIVQCLAILVALVLLETSRDHGPPGAPRPGSSAALPTVQH